MIATILGVLIVLLIADLLIMRFSSSEDPNEKDKEKF